MSSVFSMELDGISKACSTKVMMNRPVTSTAANEARNSTVVSRGFSSLTLSFSFLANLYPVPLNYCVLTVHHSKRAVPARHLKQMGRGVGEVDEFITRRRCHRHILVRVPHRPVNQQRPSDYIFLGHEAPVTA